MTYTINLDKKKEFEKWHLKMVLKQFLPFMIPLIIFMNILIGFIFSSETSLSFSISTVILIIAITDIISSIAIYFAFVLGIKMVSSRLATWELTIEENYAVLKNSSANTVVNFADFIKFKKDNSSIIFYFKGLRRFFINWDCFSNSENLKSELENIANKIGSFERESITINQPETKAQFNSKIRLFFYIIIGLIAVLRLFAVFLK